MISLPSGITLFERGWLSSNNILLEDDEQSLLVDSGYFSHSAQTISLVRAHLGERSLSRLINTHLHSDHCGGNAALQQHYPELKIFVPPGNSQHVFSWDPVLLSYEPTGQNCPPYIAHGALNIGDSFVAANLRWDILAAPGHDPHSVMFFNQSHGILISADALWENGFGVVFPEIEGVDAFDEVESTLNFIQSLDARLVIPGHGSIFCEVDDALKRAYKRLNYFKEAPQKHALYAAKVLLKFKLLELQTCPTSIFKAWARNTSYLHLLQTKHWPSMSFDLWLNMLLEQLQSINELAIEDEAIINK